MLPKIAPVPEKKKEAPKPHTCVACKRAESASLPGAKYTSSGDNSMIVTFWMCNECAVTMGPSQGPIDIDDPTTKV